MQFALDFVRLAREDPPAYIRDDLFSTRQSIAIANLGLTRKLQTGLELTLPELVELAIITTPLEAQGYAEMIALRVLLGDEREYFDDEAGTPGLVDPEDTQILPGRRQKGTRGKGGSRVRKKRLTPQELFELLEILNEKAAEHGSQSLQFAEHIEEELFSKNLDSLSKEELLQHAIRRTAFELAGGRSGILQREITSYEKLLDLARSEVLTSLPMFDKRKVTQGQFLGLNEDMRKYSRRDDLSLAVDFLADSESSESQLKAIPESTPLSQVMASFDTTLEYDRLLDRLRIDKAGHAPNLQTVVEAVEEFIRSHVQTLADILQHPELFQEGIERSKLNEISDNTMEALDALDALSQARTVDEQLGSDLSTYVYSKLKDELQSLPIHQILDHPIASPEWLDILHHALQNLGDASWQERKQLAERMMEHQERMLGAPSVVDALQMENLSQLEMMIQQSLGLEETIDTKSLSDEMGLFDHIKENLKQWMDQQISRTSSRDDLVENVESAKREGIPFSNAQVRQMGQDFGMSTAEISKLLGGLFDYLKELIENDDPAFERIESLLENAELSSAEINELTTLSIKHSTSGALGALAYHNMQEVIKNVPQSAADLLQQGLGAGSGENLLKIWFDYKGILPPWMREPVKEAAKRVAIELGKKKASSLVGSSEAGVLPNGTIRPYFLGDDPDTIDIDETLDYIMSTGKSSDAVTTEDFVVRRMVSGRRCVVFLVDISGSMTGKPLSAATLAASMLLAAFARDELAVALFESNSHVVCEIGEEIDIDTVMDTLLELQARGGTQMSAALKWARDQFGKSRSQDKMLIMVTDACLGDFDRSTLYMMEMADMGVTSLLAVPASTYGIGNIQSIIESSSAQLVPIKSWDGFPEIVSEIMSRR